MADSFGLAFAKAEEAAGSRLPLEGTVLISVTDSEKPAALEIARRFSALGFGIRATRGTQEYLCGNGVPAELVLKMHEGRPHVADAITNRAVQLVVNTPVGKLSIHDDSYIRKAAVRYKVPYITTMAAARAAVQGIEACRRGQGGVRSLQEYHADIVRTAKEGRT